MSAFSIIFWILVVVSTISIIILATIEKPSVQKLRHRDNLKKVAEEKKRALIEPFSVASEDPKLGELGESRNPPQLEAPSPGGPFRGAK